MKYSPDISVSLYNKNFINPTVLASGIMGVSGASVAYAAHNGAGAVTMKSVTLQERKGHPCPVISVLDYGNINAVGLSCPDMKTALQEIQSAKIKTSVPVIASIFAFKISDFSETAKKIADADPDFIEVNISCPNVEKEGGKPFGTDPSAAAQITESVKKAVPHIPVFIKLTPNTPDLKAVAKAAEISGADGITAINTVGPGMVINIDAARPVLANRAGGLSGPMIKPVAVRCIYDIYETVKIPIIGTGGVTTGEDAVELIMAGATLIGIGSAVYSRGIDVFQKVSDELQQFMRTHGYKTLKEIRGIAHG